MYIEILIIAVILVFIYIYRKNTGDSSYKFINKTIGDTYNKYAPYSFKVVREKAKELGLPILCRVKSVATTGVDPDYMGIGPISASQKALAKAGLTVEDIDVWEINEAFAAQCLACQQELGIDDDKLNVNGSGISLGHPVGATGARLVIAAMYELEQQNKKYGVATLCAGGGMGVAVVIERI